ncbi:hypothetical protein RDI58_020302 [Solanum bulbocastanum]|uniref:Uncharacterized protein n=1 Tax=Solanum bulbocastanum TaxID=147425 RepID=A0AAN8TBU2_SOLBU
MLKLFSVLFFFSFFFLLNHTQKKKKKFPPLKEQRRGLYRKKNIGVDSGGEGQNSSENKSRIGILKLNPQFKIFQEPKSYSLVQEFNSNPLKFGRQAGWVS